MPQAAEVQLPRGGISNSDKMATATEQVEHGVLLSVERAGPASVRKTLDMERPDHDPIRAFNLQPVAQRIAKPMEAESDPFLEFPPLRVERISPQSDFAGWPGLAYSPTRGARACAEP